MTNLIDTALESQDTTSDAIREIKRLRARCDELERTIDHSCAVMGAVSDSLWDASEMKEMGLQNWDQIMKAATRKIDRCARNMRAALDEKEDGDEL